MKIWSFKFITKYKFIYNHVLQYTKRHLFSTLEQIKFFVALILNEYFNHVFTDRFLIKYYFECISKESKEKIKVQKTSKDLKYTIETCQKIIDKINQVPE